MTGVEIEARILNELMKIATEDDMNQAMCGIPVLRAGKLYVIVGPDIIERTNYAVALLWQFAVRHEKSVFYVSSDKRANVYKKIMRAMVGPKSEGKKEMALPGLPWVAV